MLKNWSNRTNLDTFAGQKINIEINFPNMRRYVLLILFIVVCVGVNSQTSDSLIVGELRKEGVSFSDNNSVALLMSGQEKFDDMFEAIRQARSSVHLEYFNFRNDSIASLLFKLLADKVSQGVEVRALFDGFGNDSNNQPLKKSILTASAQKA